MKKVLQTIMLFCFVFASGLVLAQNRTVSGKVSSIEDGAPLPGVSVVLKVRPQVPSVMLMVIILFQYQTMLFWFFHLWD